MHCCSQPGPRRCPHRSSPVRRTHSKTARRAASSGVLLYAGGGWQSFEIDLFGPSGLTALLGSVNDALTNATIIRLYHSSALTFPGEPIAAQIGLDNITAVGAAVPEPSAVLLMAVGAMGLAYRQRRGSR